MTNQSRRYADEVTNRIDRVIRSIRSISPTLRASTASLGTSYVYTTPITAYSEINRIDGTCRALMAENDLLRDQMYVQHNLIDENNRVYRDLSKVALENEILKTENRKVPEYEEKVHTLMRQSQDINLQLNHTAREANSWKSKFDEADINGARYRTLYQNALADNERLKAEVIQLNNQITAEGLLKMEIHRLQAQNEELATLRIRLSQELLVKNEENVTLRTSLKEIEILSTKLNLSEQDNRKLREIVSIQSDTAFELKNVAKECEVLNAKLNITEQDNSKLRGIVTIQADTAVELKNTLRELEGVRAKLTASEQENIRLVDLVSNQNQTAAEMRRKVEDLNTQIAQLRVELAVIPGLEERVASGHRSNEALTKVLMEKETMIVNLNRNITNLEVEVSGLNKEIAHLNIAVDQNALYRSEIERLLIEVDHLKLKAAKLIEVEHKLAIVQHEKESLSASYTSKLENIRELNLRIAHLEEQMGALEQLKSKVVLVVNENERLNQTIVDQSRIILEWSEKYYNLEKLYLIVKDSTEHLEVVKNRFQKAVKETETTQQILRTSYYNSPVKGHLYESRYSVNSETKTVGSPSELLASPKAV